MVKAIPLLPAECDSIAARDDGYRVSALEAVEVAHGGDGSWGSLGAAMGGCQM